MSAISLLGRAPGADSLESFAQKFFAALDLPLIKQGSLGVDAGRAFYHGRKGLLQFRLSGQGGDSVLAGAYPCSVCITSTALDHDALMEEVQALLQSTLLGSGFEFRRMVAVGGTGGNSLG